ncbi:DivIVA domain-containing protein [Thermodesulfobacteriota bacterium]
MKITHQDIIDKEFRVKFRGFDMAEVDTFLEEVAEKFFKLSEENTQLNEKILALQEEIESADRVSVQGQMELPAEMVSFLEELKQDTAAINAEIVALKQDRSTFASLDKSIKEAVVFMQKAAATPPQAQTELPADLSSTLEEIKVNSETIAAEMAALKADHQAFDSLQKNLEEVVSRAQNTADAMTSPAQIELPADLNTTLEELKKSSEAIAAEMAALKTDRQTFDSLQKNLEEVVSTAQNTADAMTSPAQIELPADLNTTLEELKKNSEAIAAEMAALKTDRQTFDSLQKNLEEVVSAAQKTAPAMASLAQTEHGNLAETLDEFRKSTETMSGELADLKQEVGSIQQIREDIKSELQELLKSHFNDLEEKLSKAPPMAAQAESKPKVSAAGEKEGVLAAAIIEEEPEGAKEDTGLPGFEEQDDTYDDDLEFLSEDDILDVDKLRGVFQSVLDNSVSDTPNSREFDDDSSSDLLFLEDILEEEPEPEVSFSLEEGGAGKKPKNEAEA